MEAEPNSLPFDQNQRIAKCKNKPELLSLNEIYQQNVGGHCGYCDKEDTNYSWSFTKKKMEPYTYQLLMERGWRRCGTYYYKPNLQKSCCKLYSHRLQVERFKPKKDQKKTIKRVISLTYEKIEDIELQKKKQDQEHDKYKKEKSKIKEKLIQPQIKEEVKAQLEKICWKITEYLKTTLGKMITQVILSQDVLAEMNFDVTNKLKFFTSKPEEKWDYYSNYVMLIHGLNKKIFAHTKHSLLDFVKEVKEGIQSLNPIMTYKVQVERGGYLLFRKVLQNSSQFELLVQKEQMKSIPPNQSSKMEEEKPEHRDQSGFAKIFSSIKQKIHQKVHGESHHHEYEMKEEEKNTFEVLKLEHKYKGEFSITFNKITFGKITIDLVPAEETVESFKIYQDYCKKIHAKAEKSMSSYVSFLCLQALEFKQEHSKIDNEKKDLYIPSWDPTCKHQEAKPVTGEVKKLLGCYHMKYFFEGKLIGIGVVDIVDDGLSSVYFFYDPAFKEYRLGVFSSLIEIEYVRWMRLSFPQFKYYYMGFYVSNTQKMNYKTDYMPCQLLCPITYNFVDFTEEIKAKVARIDKGEEKDLMLAEKDAKIIEDMHFGRDLGPFIDKNLKLMYNGRKLVLKEINPQFFVHILKILKINVPVWGRTLFDIFTFTV